jgi:hypothetical protein
VCHIILVEAVRARASATGVPAAEQGDGADEALGGIVARMDMPPHARAVSVGNAGTASQLIPGVRRTVGWAMRADGLLRVWSTTVS